MTKPKQLPLLHVQEAYSVAQLSEPPTLPNSRHQLYNLSISANEISLVAPTRYIKSIKEIVTKYQDAWQLLMIEKQLDFNMVGVIASISRALSEKSISIFAVSTYETDYFLIPEQEIGRAIITLRQVGHPIRLAKSLA